jgi:molecular chaperone GrpE
MSEDPVSKTAEDTSVGEDPPADVSQLDALKRERDDMYDRLLRKTAEFDNYRKRVERERREQADRAVLAVLEDLLGVVDDFDLALDTPESDSASYRKGIELIHAKLQEVLRRQGVKPIDALGTDFDPKLHEAVMQEPSSTHRDNEVTSVLRKGYMLNDRLLRAASVKVAKA